MDEESEATTKPSKQNPPTLTQDRAAFLERDLPHLFDDVGIDATAYADAVDFTDPVTRYSSLQGYLFNIKALKSVFSPTFTLRGVRQTGPRELTTRWTMKMEVASLPAAVRPRLAFTGTSIMRVDSNGKFCAHADTWDALPPDAQAYFSWKGAGHVVGQLTSVARAAGGAAEAKGELLRKEEYEVREYPSLSVVSTRGAGYTAFKTLADWITENKVAMTTPVLSGGGAMRFVLPPGVDATAGADNVKIETVPGGPYAVRAFSGFATDGRAAREEAALRAALAADGLRVAPGAGALLAVFNGPDTVLPPARLNEVWLPLAEFDLWQ